MKVIEAPEAAMVPQHMSRIKSQIERIRAGRQTRLAVEAQCPPDP